MRFLLDTHAILWYLFGNPKLSLNAKESIENDMTIITCDGKIPLYDVKTFW